MRMELTLGAGLLATLLVCTLSCGKESPSPSQDDQQRCSLVQAAEKPTTIVTFAEGCLTSNCHSEHKHSPNLHAPVAEVRCDECHSKDTGDHVFPLLAAADDLCRSCHDASGTRLYQHGALDVGGCLACHDPHFGRTPALLKSDTEAATCSECHFENQGFVKHKSKQLETCSTCHDPHASNRQDLLMATAWTGSCGGCHAGVAHDMSTALSSHKTVEGLCMACHKAHASNTSNLLRISTGKLCLGCHEEVAKGISGARSSHQAVLTGSRCLSCHLPHASGQRHLLKSDQATVCLGCHSKPVEANDGRKIPSMTASVLDARFEHGPVQARDCTSCHDVHGSQHAHLLREASPNEMKGAFDKKYFSLCFSCHTSELVTEKTTRISTQFRQGDRNLHSLHLEKQGHGNTCMTCHAIHGSNQGRHISRSIFYPGSTWKMRLDYTPSPSGGTCLTDCHEEIPYSRDAGDGKLEAAGTKDEVKKGQ